MASYLYRGRHRKPTHTGRNLAAVGAAVSVSGAFLPVGVADARVPDPEPARSSGTIDWDVIAECESGQRNVENARSSASGFWQITDGTWRANGGTQFAPRAIGASRAEQLIVAQRIAAKRGSLADWNASRGCWGGKTGTTPGQSFASGDNLSAAPKQPQSAEPRSTARVTGQRAADGSGRYVCTADKLYFDACDPDTLGQVVDYPLYSGRHRAAEPAPVRPAAQAVSTVTSGSRGARIVSAARSWIGTPYRYGGTGRSGVDCSALVQNALRTVGVSAPRTSRAQSQWVRRISAAEARPGDLVFFYSPVSHVGIVTGPSRMIDAPRAGIPAGERAIYSGVVAWYGRIPS